MAAFNEEYISECNKHYVRAFRRAGDKGFVKLQEYCMSRHERGILVIEVGAKEIGDTYTPTTFKGVDPERRFVSWQQLHAKWHKIPGIDVTLAEAKKCVDAYDPQTSLLWMFVVSDGTDRMLFQLAKIDKLPPPEDIVDTK